MSDDSIESDHEKCKKKIKKKSIKLPAQLPYKAGIFYCPKVLTPDDIEKLVECSDYYTDQMIKEMLVPLITQNHAVSLRSLDWLATNYSKKHLLTNIKSGGGKGIKMINIYDEYSNCLARYHRMQFDPFRRRKRVYFQFEDQWYQTTVAQLMFLKWINSTGILKLAQDRIEDINQDMTSVSHQNREEKEKAKLTGKKRKRKELSKRPSMPCVVYKIPIKTRFDFCEDEEDEEGVGNNFEGGTLGQVLEKDVESLSSTKMLVQDC